jgi:hypothetical protein
MRLRGCAEAGHLSPGAACGGVRFVAVALIACSLIAGCGVTAQSGSASFGSRTTSRSSASCDGLVGFSLPTDNPNPHGTTPRQALNVFLAHGSVHGSAPPSLSPTMAGFPASGWRLVKISSDAATFESRGDKLDFTRDGNGSWVITGGSKSC